MQLFNSATVAAPAWLVCRGAGMRTIDVPVQYGLIRRPGGKAVLVDTGYGPRVTSGKRSTALRLYNALLRPQLVEAQSLAAMLASSGLRTSDVEAIVITHFHADHVARLNEFPEIPIIASGAAAEAVAAMSSFRAVKHGIFRQLLPSDFSERLMPVESFPLLPAHSVLGSGHDIFGDGTYLAIEIPGHAHGHFGLYWENGSEPTFYATDTAWSLKALAENLTPELARSVVFHDPPAGRQSEVMVREFLRNGGAVLLCHDWGILRWPSA
jgi:glyoxylase-like metal-dependent hydrolase (beta-lactamase superfamily II)